MAEPTSGAPGPDVGGAGGPPGEVPAALRPREATRIIRLDLAAIEARRKEREGLPLTEHELWLLGFDDLNFTPAAGAAVIAKAVKDAPGVRERLRAIELMARLRHAIGDDKGRREDSAVTVNVGVGVSLTIADLEAAKESARRKLTAIMARVSSVPAHVVDSEGNGSHRGNGSGVPAADGAGGGPGPAAGGP